MQDRFRFRIWDKPTSKMYYDTALGYTQNNSVGFWARANTPNYYTDYTGERLKDIEIMQSTGLKDKNGKLIYEGDIVLYPEEYCRRNKYKINLEIVWDNGRYRAQGSFTTKGHTVQFRDYYLTDFTLENGLIDGEILGNKYENPELLEDK